MDTGAWWAIIWGYKEWDVTEAIEHGECLG